MQRQGENSFKSIIRNTSLFGSVQVFQILINLIRAKFIALFLGPEGMGVNTLYVSASTFVQQVASCGINLSIVKEVASAKDSRDELQKTIYVSYRLIFLTSIFGVVLCIASSPFLSKITFGDYSKSIGFAVLSIMLFFAIAGAGMLSILQGLHAVKILAKSTLVGSLTGLIAGIPLYYYFGISGIVPSMIVLSICTFIFFFFNIRKTIQINVQHLNLSDVRPLITRIFKLGIILVISSLIGSGITYILNILIREYGSIDNVGFYQSANSITNQSVAMVFTAMSLEYFPRLSACAGNSSDMNELVNRQLVITSCLVTPIVCLLILAAPLIIRILLTESFLCTIPLIRWMAVGILFRAACYPIGYITYAQGNGRRFLLLEGIIGNILYFVISAIMYLYYGLIGLGISIGIIYSIYFFLLAILNRQWYRFSISKESLIYISVSVIMGISCFSLSKLHSETVGIAGMSIITIASFVFSALQLSKKYKSGN